MTVLNVSCVVVLYTPVYPESCFSFLEKRRKYILFWRQVEQKLAKKGSSLFYSVQ